jgi:hypothetical protein
MGEDGAGLTQVAVQPPPQPQARLASATSR